MSVTASDLDTLLNLEDTIDDDVLEAIMDQAIDLLNLHGAELPNMTGTAGSKTVSLESKERGAMFLVARAVYYSFYKGLEQTQLAGLATSSPDLLSNPNVLSTVEKAARRLTELTADVG